MENLAMSLKTELNNVSISSNLNEKGKEVKIHLKELCEEKYLPY